jgi:hypothetical protein
MKVANYVQEECLGIPESDKLLDNDADITNENINVKYIYVIRDKVLALDSDPIICMLRAMVARTFCNYILKLPPTVHKSSFTLDLIGVIDHGKLIPLERETVLEGEAVPSPADPKETKNE